MIVRTVVYHSPDGTSIDFGEYPTALSDIQGLYTPDSSSTTQSGPFQDGSTYVGTTLQEREIPITCGYVAAFDVASIQAWKRNLQKVCNPKTNDRLGEGYLEITESGVKRILNCRVDSVASPTISQQVPGSECIVTFVANDPYMYSDVSETENVSSVTKTFVFPFRFDPTIKFGSAAIGGIIVNNPGDGPADVIISVNGPCTNPVITNSTTGEYVGFEIVLDTADILTIDTKAATVAVNGLNVLQYIDIASTFWKLEPGDNNIVFTEDVGTSTATCTVQFSAPFVGF